jgi:hypothetical protein
LYKSTELDYDADADSNPLSVRTIDRTGRGEWLPTNTAVLLHRKGVATWIHGDDIGVVLFLDE